MSDIVFNHGERTASTRFIVNKLAPEQDCLRLFQSSWKKNRKSRQVRKISSLPFPFLSFHHLSPIMNSPMPHFYPVTLRIHSDYKMVSKSWTCKRSLKAFPKTHSRPYGFHINRKWVHYLCVSWILQSWIKQCLYWEKRGSERKPLIAVSLKHVTHKSHAQ
jgi:hypothetical protein